VGEAKAHLAKRHINELLRRATRLEQHGLLRSERLLVAVTHLVRPQIQRYADSRGVVVVPSYLLEG
jgi:cytosine/adenosine deaminase-related metal-dependent hydrolase